MTSLPPDPAAPPFFSLEEANRMLPLVRRIVGDITQGYTRLQDRVARFNRLTPRERQIEEAEQKQAVERLATELDRLVAELHELGCRFKGFEDGLVDWYSYYAGRPVCLCWKADEAEIGWWHQVDAGLIGRQRIRTDQRSAFTAEP